MESKDAVYVVGDVHGQLGKLTALLRRAGLVGERLEWKAGEATLVFIGDFFDRGPDGIGCLNLAMGLQEQAGQAGGQVLALLGNHEIMVVSAARFRQRLTKGPGGTFVDDWQFNGGQLSELPYLTEAHIEWLAHLPAMLLIQDHLLIHADAMFYLRYGSSVTEVNAKIHALLEEQDASQYERILDDFGEREAFLDDEFGVTRARKVLKQYGGRRIVHGHTPIARMVGRKAREVRIPLVYAGGLVVNVDAGLYMGGDGFVFRLPDKEEGA